MAHLTTNGNTLREKIFDVVLADDEPFACEIWPVRDMVGIRISLYQAAPIMVNLDERDAKHLRDLLNARFPVE